MVAGNTDGSAAVGLEPDTASHNSGKRTPPACPTTGSATRPERVGTAFPAPSTPGTPNINADYVGTPAAPIYRVLSALVDNGGPTRTHRPLVASPVIDQGATVRRGPGPARVRRSPPAEWPDCGRPLNRELGPG